jgi:hypothetical protein
VTPLTAARRGLSYTVFIANHGERTRRFQMARSILSSVSALVLSAVTLGGTLALFAAQTGPFIA